MVFREYIFDEIVFLVSLIGGELFTHHPYMEYTYIPSDFLKIFLIDLIRVKVSQDTKSIVFVVFNDVCKSV